MPTPSSCFQNAFHSCSSLCSFQFFLFICFPHFFCYFVTVQYVCAFTSPHCHHGRHHDKDHHYKQQEQKRSQKFSPRFFPQSSRQIFPQFKCIHHLSVQKLPQVFCSGLPVLFQDAAQL